MFRLQNNVPEVYVQESRDFQLFCRLYDSVFGGLKYDTDSLLRSIETSKCPEQLFELLKLKVGLFTNLPLTNDQLRLLLIAYPTLIRYKGTKKGLDFCAYLIQRMTKTLHSNVGMNVINNTHTVQVIIQENEILNQLFIELIKTVIPTGYNLEILISETFTDISNISVEDNLRVYSIQKSNVLDDYISEEEIGKSDNDADMLTSVIGLSSITDNERGDIKP